MTPRKLRQCLSVAIIASSSLVIITCETPIVGMLGFILICVGAALWVDD